MFVQLICRDRSPKEIEELYQIIGAICEREGIQAEERGDAVEILVCPQGKILVTEEDRDVTLTANTRHAGAGFHAFCVDIFKDIEEEQPGKYELIDDLEYANDEDFHRLHHVYENELDYIRNLILTDPDFRRKNYLYDETYFQYSVFAVVLLSFSDKFLCGDKFVFRLPRRHKPKPSL